MRKLVAGAALEHLFAEEQQGSPCPEGTVLLRVFADQRPADFAFLQPRDLTDIRSSTFAGIPEWDAFSAHYARCERCHA